MPVDLAIIVIGRNEGERLRACLDSLGERLHSTVYVDSGSSDGSVALARSRGAEVVELDPHTPFTAARARNAGRARALEIHGDPQFLLFLDGDCTLAEGWIDCALEEFEAHPEAAVVCGRRRERFPEASVFNRLCDMEWNTPLGEAEACGGDALFRGRALTEVGTYNPDMIAGEEPDLCYRLRAAGWSVRRIDAEMTLHDADIRQVGQWWKRATRSGHASAELARRHPKSGATDLRRIHSALAWSGLGWSSCLATVLWAVWAPQAWALWSALPVSVIALHGIQFARIRAACLRRGDARRDAHAFAFWCLAAKTPEALGWGRFTLKRLRGAHSTLIEYKGPDASAEGSSDLARPD